jgi:uncharacterized protein
VKENKMNILIVTAHPAQVHNFKLVKKELESRGHSVFWLATEKDISRYLLDYYDIDYEILSRPGASFLSKLLCLFKNNLHSFNVIKSRKIDLIISRPTAYAGFSCLLARKPHISLADTEGSGVYGNFNKLASVFLTPRSYQRILRKDQIRFDANIELFYLHPNRFEPDEGIFHLLGIEKRESYVIMRFVSWGAYHDKGLSGFTDANKIRAVQEFSKHARVFISAEKDLPPELEAYKIKIPPERMHDALAFASLFFGESATMASESAVLGTPAIYMDKIGRGYTDEEEQYGLLFSFKSNLNDQERAIAKGTELLADPETKETMRKNREIFLQNKIDPTAFMVWFIENYPESARLMQKNPDYQYRFK